MKVATKCGGLFVWAVVAAGLAGCGFQVGSGRYAEDVRQTPAFTRLDVSDGIAAEVVVGEAQSVTVTGDDDLINEIHTDVRSGTLVVEIPHRLAWSSDLGLVVKITVPQLEGAGVSGGGRLDLTGIDADAFSCEASGGSKVSLSGQATSFSLDTSGGSSVNAAEFAVDKANIHISGGGSARVRVETELAAELSGGSRLTVIGRPAISRSDLSGGSEIITQP